MATRKESTLDSKSSLVDADRLRIINSADNSDSENITYQNLKTALTADLSFPSNPLISSNNPAGSYTILDADGYTHIINSATGTITLPTLSANYNRIITIIRDVATSTTPLIIDGEGAETINADTVVNIYGRYGCVSVMASQDAGEWVIVAENKPPTFFSSAGLGSNTALSTSGRTLLLSTSITKDAKYLITGTISVFNTANDDRLVQAFIENNSSSTTLTRAAGSIKWITSATYDCIAMSVVQDLSNGDSVRLLAQATSANTSGAAGSPSQTSMTIVEIASQESVLS